MATDPNGLSLHTNAGVLKCKKHGEFAKYGSVWHDSRALTNILSFYNLQTKYDVVFDNRNGDNSFHVFTKDGKEILFSPSDNGIYRYDNSKRDFCFTETVAENAKFYTKRQVEQAKMARKLYHAVGTPSIQDFRTLIRSNMIKNCPVSEEDIQIAEKIFGKGIVALKGKLTRSKPTPFKTSVVPIPKALKQQHHKVELCADVMFIQNMLFLMTILRRICYQMV